MKYYVLEWNALDDRIDLYDFQSKSNDIAQVYEEVSEELHNYAFVLVMDKKKLANLIDAVDNIKKKLKLGKSARVRRKKAA